MKSQSVTNLHGSILFLLFLVVLCGNLAQVYDTGGLFLNDYNTNNIQTKPNMELYVLCVHLQILNHVTCIYEFQTVLLKLVSFSCLVIHIVTCNYKRAIYRHHLMLWLQPLQSL